MRPPRFLLLRFGLGHRQTRRPRLGKSVVRPLIQRQLPVFEMQDRGHRTVQKAPVMADRDDRMRILRQIALQPKGAFQVQIVRRLVQSKRSGAENSTPARATRIRQPPEKALHGMACSACPKPRPFKIDEARASADQASISAKPRLHIGDPRRVTGRLGLGQKAGPFLVRLQHRVQKRGLAARHLLSDTPDAKALRQADVTALQRQLAPDQPEERGFACAVPARRKPTLWPSGMMTLAPSNRGRPSMAKRISSILNMAA